MHAVGGRAEVFPAFNKLVPLYSTGKKIMWVDVVSYLFLHSQSAYIIFFQIHWLYNFSNEGRFLFIRTLHLCGYYCRPP